MEYPKLHSNKVRVPSQDDPVTRPLHKVAIHPDLKHSHCHFR